MKLDLAYIVQAETPDGLIKIGRSGSPSNRIAQIAQAVPFQIRTICILAHGARTEREMKDALRPAKVKGEWYEPDDLLIKFLEQAHQNRLIVEQGPVDEVFYEEVILPKIIGFLQGRPLKRTDAGDLVYRMMHGDPLAFMGREELLTKNFGGNTFTFAELLGYRPARSFGPVVLNGRKIETAPPVPAPAEERVA